MLMKRRLNFIPFICKENSLHSLIFLLHSVTLSPTLSPQTSLIIELPWVEWRQKMEGKMAEASASLKESSSLEKQEESEGRRMESFRKVMRKCLDKIMATGR